MLTDDDELRLSPEDVRVSRVDDDDTEDAEDCGLFCPRSRFFDFLTGVKALLLGVSGVVVVEGGKSYLACLTKSNPSSISKNFSRSLPKSLPRIF